MADKTCTNRKIALLALWQLLRFNRVVKWVEESEQASRLLGIFYAKLINHFRF